MRRCLTDKAPAAIGWKTIPSWYVMGDADKVIPPDIQEKFATRAKSKVYHVPGGGNYERTKPDRCYVDAAAAEADGLRAAKR